MHNIQASLDEQLSSPAESPQPPSRTSDLDERLRECAKRSLLDEIAETLRARMEREAEEEEEEARTTTPDSGLSAAAPAHSSGKRKCKACQTDTSLLLQYLSSGIRQSVVSQRARPSMTSSVVSIGDEVDTRFRSGPPEYRRLFKVGILLP